MEDAAACSQPGMVQGHVVAPEPEDIDRQLMGAVEAAAEAESGEKIAGDTRRRTAVVSDVAPGANFGPDGYAHGYVVSIQARSRFRRLHFIGLCHRVPGLDYKIFEVLGDSRPPRSSYTAVCKDCWPGGPADFGSASSGTSESSSAVEPESAREDGAGQPSA